jgi:hypothetical protein
VSIEGRNKRLGRDDAFRIDADLADAAREGIADRRVDGGVFERGEEGDGV